MLQTIHLNNIYNHFTIFNPQFFNILGHSLGSRKRYIQLLKTQSTSVVNQLKILKAHLPNKYSGLVVHTLKKNASVSKQDDR